MTVKMKENMTHHELVQTLLQSSLKN